MLVYCGQTVGWIKMKLGTEVGLGHIVLDGDPAPPKCAQPPIFGPCLLWPNGWIDQDTTWHGRKQDLAYETAESHGQEALTRSHP